MKVCKECGVEKGAAGFYACVGNSDGLMGKCKECWKAQVKERRRTNPTVQAYDRARAKTPARKAHARAVTKKWRLDKPDAYRAQTAVGNALRDGRITRPSSCGVEGCDRSDLHAHHDDYSKPLEVRWLCPLHHHRHHAAQGDL